MNTSGPKKETGNPLHYQYGRHNQTDSTAYDSNPSPHQMSYDSGPQQQTYYKPKQNMRRYQEKTNRITRAPYPSQAKAMGERMASRLSITDTNNFDESQMSHVQFKQNMNAGGSRDELMSFVENQKSQLVLKKTKFPQPAKNQNFAKLFLSSPDDFEEYLNQKVKYYLQKLATKQLSTLKFSMSEIIERSSCQAHNDSKRLNINIGKLENKTTSISAALTSIYDKIELINSRLNLLEKAPEPSEKEEFNKETFEMMKENLKKEYNVMISEKIENRTKELEQKLNSVEEITPRLKEFNNDFKNLKNRLGDLEGDSKRAELELISKIEETNQSVKTELERLANGLESQKKQRSKVYDKFEEFQLDLDKGSIIRQKLSERMTDEFKLLKQKLAILENDLKSAKTTGMSLDPESTKNGQNSNQQGNEGSSKSLRQLELSILDINAYLRKFNIQTEGNSNRIDTLRYDLDLIKDDMIRQRRSQADQVSRILALESNTVDRSQQSNFMSVSSSQASRAGSMVNIGGPGFQYHGLGVPDERIDSRPGSIRQEIAYTNMETPVPNPASRVEQGALKRKDLASSVVAGTDSASEADSLFARKFNSTSTIQQEGGEMGDINISVIRNNQDQSDVMEKTDYDIARFMIESQKKGVIGGSAGQIEEIAERSEDSGSVKNDAPIDYNIQTGQDHLSGTQKVSEGGENALKKKATQEDILNDWVDVVAPDTQKKQKISIREQDQGEMDHLVPFVEPIEEVDSKMEVSVNANTNSNHNPGSSDKKKNIGIVIENHRRAPGPNAFSILSKKTMTPQPKKPNQVSPDSPTIEGIPDFGELTMPEMPDPSSPLQDEAENSPIDMDPKLDPEENDQVEEMEEGASTAKKGSKMDLNQSFRLKTSILRESLGALNHSLFLTQQEKEAEEHGAAQNDQNLEEGVQKVAENGQNEPILAAGVGNQGFGDQDDSITLQVDDEGFLLDADGYPILDDDGHPIKLTDEHLDFFKENDLYREEEV